MAQNKQIQISAALLEELIVSAEAVTGFVGATVDDNARAALARLNKAISSTVVLLRSSTGPGSFSGKEVGEYRVDPSQSPFL